MIESILHYDFIRNTFLTGILIGIIAPLLGTFIVVRRLSLIADALSHITLAGIAAGLLLNKKLGTNFSPIYIGMTFSVLGANLIEYLRKQYKQFQELAIPILLSLGVGLGVIFISLAEGFTTDLFSYLFGSVTAVSLSDFYTIFVITIIVVAFIFIFYKEMFLLSFDEEYAIISGVKAKALHFLFMILVALVIAASMRVVGILLVSSLITLPVAASLRVAKGFKQAVIFSVIFGETAVMSGLFSAYYLNLPPGGTIVIISTIILIGAMYWSKISYRLSKSEVGS